MCQYGPGRGCSKVDDDDNGLELKNFNCFMAALCKCLTDHKVMDHIKIISQGQRSMAEYTQEFHDLTCWLNDWPQDTLNGCFKYRLTDESKHLHLQRCSPLWLVCSS